MPTLRPHPTVVRLAAAALWIALTVAWVGFAPPIRPELGAWVQLAVTLRAPDDPWVLVHFQLMGLWPLAWCGLLDRWWVRPGVPAWPFALGTMVMGAWALLPWFVLTGFPEPEEGPPPLPWRAAGHPALGAFIALPAAALLAWGALYGDLATWASVREQDGFVWLMTWDYLALQLTAAAVVAARDDRPRPWLLAFGVFGAGLWLLQRRTP